MRDIGFDMRPRVGDPDDMEQAAFAIQLGTGIDIAVAALLAEDRDDRAGGGLALAQDLVSRLGIGRGGDFDALQRIALDAVAGDLGLHQMA